MQVLEVPTSRIQQVTGYYCGAACSQMMLRRANIEVSQDELYKDIRENNSESDAFYSDPDGISRLLNTAGLDPFPLGDVIVIEDGTDSQIASQIFDNLFDNKIPAVCLVNSGNHWVICHKVIYDLDSDRRVSLLGIFLLDPSPVSPPEVYVPLDQFLSSVLNPNSFGHKWKGKRIFLAGREAVSRARSVGFVSQSAMGGGAGIPDPQKVIDNLKKVGISSEPSRGGGAQPLRVIDLYDKTEYFVSLFDAVNDSAMKSMIYVAATEDNRVLEVTAATDRAFYANDELVAEALYSEMSITDGVIDPQLYWKRHSILQNRFVIARRVTKDGEELWILPSGEVRHSLDIGPRGGR